MITIPPGLETRRTLGPDWARWLDILPRRYADMLDAWELEPDGVELWHGYCSLVAPVRTADGERAVLKLTFDGDDESQHEALALRYWAGNGVVRLLRAEPSRRVLLLERVHRDDLTTIGDIDACAVVGSLYPRLHRASPPQLRTVASYAERWIGALAASSDGAIPRRLVGQAVSTGRALIGDPSSSGTLVHGDLHYENVLAADREPWLVIDPKPMSGDPHYEVAPMLWNRWDDLDAFSSIRDGLRTRFFTLVDAAGLDEDRARAWVVVRVVLNAHWVMSDAEAAGRAMTRCDRSWVTHQIAIAKAVQE